MCHRSGSPTSRLTAEYPHSGIHSQDQQLAGGRGEREAVQGKRTTMELEQSLSPLSRGLCGWDGHSELSRIWANCLDP